MTVQPDDEAMKASDVMVPHAISVSPELNLKAVANTLVTNGISAVPVIDLNNRIVGIISEADLMRQVSGGEHTARLRGRKAEDVMTRQVITVDPDTSLQEIANLIEKHRIKRVLVVKDGTLVGVVSRANIVQALLR